MKSIAVIPARGGSKRLPGKNIRDFLGRPIIAYSIETALWSGLFERVIVSTDCEKIANVALKYGAEVPFLQSKETSGGQFQTMDAVREVLDRLGEHYDYGCCIYAISPLTRVEHLRRGYFLMKKCDAVRPIVRHSQPIEWTVRIKDELMEPLYPRAHSHPIPHSSEYEVLYILAGGWNWFDPQKVYNVSMGERTGYVILKEYETQDIDDEEDWKMAELKYKLCMS